MNKERYELGIGSLVVFKCSNPAVGYIKRMAKNQSWSDVTWISNGLNQNYTSRVKTKDIVPLNGVLNYWMVESNIADKQYKFANGNFWLPPGC